MRPVIEVGGVDITADVQFPTAKFISQASGAAGSFDIYVKDTGHNKGPFVTGAEVTVDLGADRVFGGYLRKLSREWPFPVEPTLNNARNAPRYWHLSGTDYNTLLNQRVIYNHRTPTIGNAAGSVAFTYPPGDFDDTVIRDLLTNFTDLLADGITLDGVQRVGIVVFDVPGVTSGRGLKKGAWPEIAAAGYTVQQALYTIARNTGAIFYIDPSKVFDYVDVDTANSPYTLTDQPSGPFDVGYRELEILFDGSKLDNDAMVWGSTLGSAGIVFSRVQDAASIALHGRWQSGLNTAALYRQISADAVAGSYVFGTPTSHRGGKDPRIGFTATVFNTPLIVAQKLRTVSAINGFDDIYPIRRIEMTFPTPNDVKMVTALSWEPDIPWSFYEANFGKAPTVTPIPPIPPIPPLPIIPPTPPNGCINPLILDDFDRIGMNDFGFTSNGNRAWSLLGASGLTAYGTGFGDNPVTGAFAHNDTGADGGSVAISLTGVTDDAWTIGTRFQWSLRITPSGAMGGGVTVRILGTACNLAWAVTTGGSGSYAVIDTQNGLSASFPVTSWSSDVEFILEGYADQTVGAGVRAYLPGDPLPAWTAFAYSGQSVGMDTSCALSIEASNIPFPSIYYWRSLTICCTPTPGGGGSNGELTDLTLYDTFGRSADKDFGGTSYDGRLWTGDYADPFTGIDGTYSDTDWGTNGAGGFFDQDPAGFTIGGAFLFIDGDKIPSYPPPLPWADGATAFAFSLNVEMGPSGGAYTSVGGGLSWAAVGTGFEAPWQGPTKWSWGFQLSNDPTLGNGPSVSFDDLTGGGPSILVDLDPGAFSPGVTYAFEGFLDTTAGTAGVRLFQVGSTPPDWSVATGMTSGVLPEKTDFLGLAFSTASPGLLTTFEWSNLQFGNASGGGPATSCVPFGPPPQLDGLTCETPTTYDHQRYETAYNYASGSLEVWLNGILQRIGVDYNEHPAAPTGSPDDRDHYLVFVNVVASADTVYICYYGLF